MIKSGYDKTHEQQQDEELATISSSFVAEVKAELGEHASVNQIEAALLKKQQGLMSKLMQNPVASRDFPPLDLTAEGWHKDGKSKLSERPKTSSSRSLPNGR